MTEDQLSYLRVNREELALKLLRHCCIIAGQNYGWYAGQTLPLGKYPDLLVCEVIDDFFQGRRNFNTAYGVETQLKGAVRSELSALYRRKEAKARPFKSGDDDTAPCDFAELEPGPAELAMNKHDSRKLFELYAAHPDVKGNEELETLLLAIEEGADDTPTQAKATGIAEKRIYELRRKLREIYPTILKQFQQQLPCTK
jgi:hypothetical protein